MTIGILKYSRTRVSRGVSFFAFHKLGDILPNRHFKKVAGFDSFEGLTDFNAKDGKTLNDENNDKKTGDGSLKKLRKRFLNFAGLQILTIFLQEKDQN